MKKLLIFLILGAALILRTYRSSVLTGFYFDQGRDAKVIWDLIHDHKFFLIGPTTGIEGIFLGPAFYYLITPFYFLGQGNPVFPAVGLAVICVTGIWVLYVIARKYFDHRTGLIVLLLVSFSLTLVQAHRWLSNPTPLFLSSALALFFILKLVYGSRSGWVWLLLGLTLGLSLQFEAASAVFFLPAVLFIFLVFKKTIVWNFGRFIHLLFSFLLTLLPQLIFDMRHDHILVMAFKNFLLTQKSFAPSGSEFVVNRLKFYFESLSGLVTLDHVPAIIISLVLVLFGIKAWRYFPKKPLTVILIWILTPLIFLLLYQGNNGYIWSYYFTGIYFGVVLLVAAVLSYTYTYSYLPFKKGLVGALIAYFLVVNSYHLYHYLRANPDGPTAVMLGSSLAAVDWVYRDAGSRPFNIDIYVPPVIPHAYDYLFLWRGSGFFHVLPDSNSRTLLYTLYEVDPPHPERLHAWLTRQAAYATPEASVRFGGITVDRRWRY